MLNKCHLIIQKLNWLSKSLIEGLKCHLLTFLHHPVFASGKTDFALPGKPIHSRTPVSPQHKGRPVCLPNTKLTWRCLLTSWVLSCSFHSSPESSSLPAETRASLLYFFLFRNGIHFYLRMLQRVSPSMCRAVLCPAHFRISGFPHTPEQDHFNPYREFTNPEANSFHHKPNSRQATEYLYLRYICVRA